MENVDDPQPGTNPAITLGTSHRRYVEQAQALADAGDAGREALAKHLGEGSSDPGMVYAAGFGAARVMLRNLLDVIGDLAEALRVYDEDDGTEASCTACGQWVGMFHGLEGWHHFRGDPSPGGHRTLYEADHEAVTVMLMPPGRALSPADMGVVRHALADASAWRTWRGGRTQCADCARLGPERCADHAGDGDLAAAYERLLRGLVVAGEVSS